MFDMFSELFGGQKQVKPDLLSRILDLELAVVHGDTRARGRITERLGRHEATAEQREVFMEAFRTDLEMAHLHNLASTDVPAKEGFLRGSSAVKGHQSISAAIMAYEFAEAQLWEWAKTMFEKANEAASDFWGRSRDACGAIVLALSRVEEAEPVAVSQIEDLFTSLEVIPDHRLLGEARRAETPLEWVEHWHAFCLSSRAFRGLVNDEILDAAKAGEWTRLISYEEEVLESRGFSSVPAGKTKTVILQPELRVPSQGVRTLLGKHLKTIRDTDAKAQELRLWKHVWWGSGCRPKFHAPGFGCDYGLRKHEDGLWYLDKYTDNTEYTDTKRVTTREWGDTHEHWEKGCGSEAKAMTAAWKTNIYKEKA